MKGPVEQREPVADERRTDWVVEQRSHRLVGAFPLEQEDDLALGQEDDVSVEGLLEILGAQSRVFCEKSLRSLIGAGFQAGSKDEAIHGGSLLRPHRAARSGARGDLRRAEAAGRQAAELAARGDLELPKDLVQVVLNRSWADEQPSADLASTWL